ncbi:hypothetical protein AJ78_04435 [Emergomyces pasteurianus Ep9510]|uniref:Uncharacterized protein n=1 Tax=Emergomyces pasteurianus Ep9510 TaxID=1447872 RepID=A0A1J9PH04_9EURO|nr:hypothetical protein AJ78_04435 [Emergomyces pasteurianus Ep9510]
MSSAGSLGRQWPPSPSVEDESESLSREILDPSILDKMLDNDTVISKGTVDQYPLILPSDIATPCSTPTDASAGPIDSKAGSKSSKENMGLPTAPSPPSAGCASDRQHESSNPTSSGFPLGLPATNLDVEVHQKPSLSRNFSEGDEKLGFQEMAAKKTAWHSDDEARPLHRGSNCPEPTSNTGPAKKIKKKVNFQLPHEPPSGRLPTVGAESALDHDLEPPHSPSEEVYTSRRSSLFYEDGTPMDNDPTFVTYRQDSTYLAHPQPLKLSGNYGGTRSRVSEPTSPVTSPPKLISPTPSQSPKRHSPNPTAYRLNPISRTALDVTKAILSNPNKDSRASADSSPVRRRGPFLSPPLLPSGYEVIVRRGTDKQSHRNSFPAMASSHLLSRSRSSTIPSQVLVRRHQPVTDAPPLVALAPCSRSIPMAGHQDWYTIKGLTHLDVCPCCIDQIGGSRFRELFIRSIPKARDAKIRCAFSQPWVRLAWVQTMKLKLNHLELLQRITRPPPGTRVCSGRNPSVQPWFRLSDPETGRNVTHFNACSACFRNLQILMPSLRDAFRSGPLVQERICDLRIDSPRFVRYLDLLDEAATRSYSAARGRLDMREFVKYARRKSSIRDCPRDHFSSGPWHFIPELPEFTVCEDCYDDVVYDYSHTGIGKMVSRTPQMTPGRRDQQQTCQLYSPRMRTVFREAVQHGDFKYLATTVLRRHEAENLFRERKKGLLDDVARGYDRDAELRWNAEDWRRCE